MIMPKGNEPGRRGSDEHGESEFMVGKGASGGTTRCTAHAWRRVLPSLGEGPAGEFRCHPAGTRPEVGQREWRRHHP
jgi:hypothetical protein